MPELGSLWWRMGIKDLTDADFKKINARLKNLGFDITLTPKIIKELTQAAVPKGVKIELDPIIKNEALARAVEGKVLNISVKPLMSNLRSALREATKENPPEMEVGVQSAKLRRIIEEVLNKQGFMLNISTVNDNYSKVVQQKLNGTRYTVKIHADAKEITRSVQTSLMQVQSRAFGLQISRDILYRSIDEALGAKRFNINVAVQHDQARKAVQDALLRAQVIGKDQALAYQRLQTGELKAAQAELVRLKAAHMGAADAAKTHASASVNLGGAMGSNIKIAGELGSAMASLYSVHAAKQFLSQVVDIGGELEHQKIAMDTIFGDKGKTSELAGQIKGLARQSPFGVMELTKSVKALSAYGVQYNEIYDTAKRLADISAATSVDINRLILAFGKTKSRGFLDGLEAKQFAYANIPIYEMVRRKLEELEGQAVTTAQVMERMKKREIGFDIVKDVLWDMTDEGGKFYNMQEALAGSVKTSWKLVRDNIELMFGEIAESGVGDALKDIAQILQALTRNWRTLGAVIAGAAVVLGVYKAATLASNIAIDKGTAAVYSNVMAEKARTAQQYRTLGVIGGLDASQKDLIKTVKTLTLGEFNLLLTEKKLSSAQILRLGLAGKLSKRQLMYAASVGKISREEAKAIIRGRLWGMNLGQLGNSLKLAGAQLRAFGAAFASFWPIAAVTAAISAVTYVWQKNSEQMEKAKEIGDNLFTKATEGADNLRQTLKEIKPSAGLSEHELSQGIEQMEQVIKDYSPRPLQDINDTLVAQDGHVMTLSERYDALKKRIEEVAEAYELIGDVEKGDGGTIISDAIKSTGGWLNDDVITNAKDYSEALKRRSDAIRKYSIEYPRSIKKAVERAIEIDNEFAKATEGMRTTAAKWNELASNPTKYNIAYSAPEVGMILANAGLGELNEDIEKQKSTFESDVQKSIKEIAASVRITWDKEIKDLDDSEKDALVIMLKNMLNQAEGMSEEARAQWAKALETAFGVSILEEDDFKRVWAEQLNKAFSGAPEYLKEALLKARYFGAESLGAILDDMPQYTAKAFDATMKIFPEKEAEIKEWLRGHSLTWTIDFAFANAPESQKASEAVTSLVRKTGLTGLTPEIDKLLVRWGKSNDPQQMRQMAAEEWKAAKERLDSAKLWGESSEIYQSALSDFQAKDATLAYLNWEDLKLERGRDSNKDSLAESLKQRLDVLKKAYSEYKKELAIMSKDAALERIKEAGIFDELFTGKYAIGDFGDYKKVLEKLLADAEASLEGLSEKDKNFKGRHDLVISLRTLLNLEIPYDEAKEAFEKTKSEIDNLVKGYTDKWNFHKQLFELTGDRETSVKLAFGEDVAWQTQSQMLESILNTQLAERGLDVPLTISDEEAKEKLEKTPLLDLWRKTKEAIEKEDAELQINVAKAVADAASTADKIKVQMGLREADETMLRSRKKADGTEYSETEIAAYLKKYDNRIEELKSSMLELLPIWEQIFGDHQYQSYGQIQEIARITNEIVANADVKKENGKPVSFSSFYTDEKGNRQNTGGKISQLEKLRKAIQELYKEGLKKNPFATLWENLKKVFNGDWKDKNITEKLALIGESAAESAQLVGNLAGQLAEMFEAAGNDSAAQAMTDVQDVMNSVSNIGKGFAEGGLVGGIAAAAGEAIGWVTKAFQASARHKEALRAIMNETLAQQREYNLLLMQQNLEYKKAATILGEDTYGKAKNAVKVMKDAYKDLQDELAGTAEQQGNERRKVNSSRMVARMFGLGFDEAKAKLRQAYAGLADIEIKTGHKKTGLFGWGKGKDIYSSILDVYPDLIDANSKFNSSLAETIINTRVMSDEDKAALQNMIDLAEQAEAAYEELNSYMTDIFGELGSSMTDALVSAFANGTDAAEDFYDSVSDMLEALAKQMIYSVTLAPLIEEAQKKMMDVMQNDAMSDEQKFGAWTGILDGLLDDALKQQGVANDLFKKYQDMAAEKGFDIFKPDEDSKSGLSAGIQGVTEDTADLLASYLNAIRADVAMQTGSYWTRLLDDSLPQMNIIAQSQLDTQRQIAENTLRNAVAAEAIQVSTAKLVELNDQMGRSWRRIAERNWGYS